MKEEEEAKKKNPLDILISIHEIDGQIFICSLLIAVDFINASSAMIENQDGIVAFNE